MRCHVSLVGSDPNSSAKICANGSEAYAADQGDHRARHERMHAECLTRLGSSQGLRLENSHRRGNAVIILKRAAEGKQMESENRL